MLNEKLISNSILNFSDEDGGIEMQVLKTPPVDLSSSVDVERHSHSDEISCANSAISIDYQEHLASTIGECLTEACDRTSVNFSCIYRFKSRRTSKK